MKDPKKELEEVETEEQEATSEEVGESVDTSNIEM